MKSPPEPNSKKPQMDWRSLRRTHSKRRHSRKEKNHKEKRKYREKEIHAGFEKTQNHRASLRRKYMR